MINPVWQLNQQNLITFAMINNAGVEVAGLGGAFAVFISKNGAMAVPGVGTKSEIGNGLYAYLATAAEADTVGTVTMYVNGAGCVQQNLEYVVLVRNINAIHYTYTVTNPLAVPLEGVEVWFSTDIAGSNIVWKGFTDIFGVARDSQNDRPWLDPGTYYVWSQKTGYSFVNPDTEVVS